MKNFLENIKKIFTGGAKPAEVKKEEPSKVLPPLSEQRGDGTKAGHGIKGQITTEDKKKRRKKYFPKQKGQGTKAHHGRFPEKTIPRVTGAEERKAKPEASGEKSFKPKKSQQQNDSTYRKRENVKNDQPRE